MFKRASSLWIVPVALLVGMSGGCGNTPDGNDRNNGGTKSSAGDSSGGVAAGGTSANGDGGAMAGSTSGGTTDHGGGASTAGETSGGAEAGGSGAAGGGGGPPLPPELVWTKQGPARTIEAIWGSGAENIYAVGLTGALLHSTGDGTWTTQSAGTSANLTGVWGSGPTDVYVSVDSNTFLHSVGDGKWEHQAYDSGFTFNDIWGLDSSHVFAVGPGVVRGTGNGAWQSPPEEIGTSPTFALWGSSPSDLYAATGKSNNSTIYHSTGDGNWVAQSTPAATSAVDIIGVDATHLYAAADNFVLRSNGSGTWTVELTTPSVQKVLALWAASADAVYACTQEGFFYRSNGHGAWSEGVDLDPSVRGDCAAVWGTGPDDIYVGGSGGIYHGTAP